MKAALEKHKTETEEHVARLEKVFEEIEESPRAKTCDAIMGIIEEGQEVMKEFKGAPPWTQACSLRRRRSSITRSPATGHLKPGPPSLV